MANPQLEDGYTRIANEILDALAGIRIPGESWQILNVIFRKTYGFQKKEDKISLTQFVELTKIKKPNVLRGIKKLINMNIVIQKDNSDIISYCFNKRYKEWKPLSKKITLSKKIIAVIQKDNKSLSKKIPTKDIKDTLTKDKGGYVDYSIIIDQYNLYCPPLPKIIKITDSRKKAMQIRLREYPDPEFWKDYFKRAANSKFLLGQNDRNWKTDFDFLLKPEKIVNLLEGKYDNKEGAAPRSLYDELERKYGPPK